MNRTEYDAKQALTPGTWQNRQGRENEWLPASPGATGFAMGVVALALVSLASLLVAVLA